MNNYTTSQSGIDAITSYEGQRLTAYPDPGTGGVPWTIGVGHTGGVQKGDTCTAAESNAFLRADLRSAEAAVNQLVTVLLTQSQFDALVSFTFNLGTGALRGSSLLKMLNLGEYEIAADEFLRWNQAAGQVLPGLVKRRAAERAMFLIAAPATIDMPAAGNITPEIVNASPPC